MELACAAQPGVDMYLNRKIVLLLTSVMLAGLSATGAVKKRHKTAESEVESTATLHAVLWRDPADIASRDLYYGPGGKEHPPHPTFTFVNQNLPGSNPKFAAHHP